MVTFITLLYKSLLKIGARLIYTTFTYINMPENFQEFVST